MRIILLTVAFIMIAGCKEKPKPQVVISETKIKNRCSILEIKDYYKKNNWTYPNDVSFETIDFQKCIRDSVNILQSFNTSNLRNELLKWIVKNYDKRDEAARISNFLITKGSVKKGYSFDCKVCFYRKGEFVSDGLIAPIEGHGIVERSIYIQVEYPNFSFDKVKLRLLNWGG